MPTLTEFINGFGFKELFLTLITAAIIIAVRESSPLGIFGRRKRDDKERKN